MASGWDPHAVILSAQAAGLSPASRVMKEPLARKREPYMGWFGLFLTTTYTDSSQEPRLSHHAPSVPFRKFDEEVLRTLGGLRPHPLPPLRRELPPTQPSVAERGRISRRRGAFGPPPP